MDGIPITRSYLETLTSGELIKWADYFGLEILPGLDRIFIIEELLEIAASDMEFEEEHPEAPIKKNMESAFLPRQYNITFIETLVRDPLWAFVFWEVKGADREIFENADDFLGYFLKISPWERIAPEEIFSVPLSLEDSARYLGFPPKDGNNGADDARNRSFKVELFAEQGEEEIFLAASNPFRLPTLSPRIEKQENWLADKYPLIALSGIKDFHILKNGDRQFRAKRHDSSAALRYE